MSNSTTVVPLDFKKNREESLAEYFERLDSYFTSENAPNLLGRKKPEFPETGGDWNNFWAQSNAWEHDLFVRKIQAFKHALNAITLVHPELDSINIQYSGAGDDGDIEDVEFYDRKGKVINISSDDLIYKHVSEAGWWITEDVAPGFECNEGGQGEIDIKKDHNSLGEWKCTCNHEQHRTTVEHVDVEMF
tara:strand:- start:1584 stop:2153 length:570 start_codon:yes stop_codon:yes gene_type:complete